ncbi:unnamed protein product [Bemisia tabaci]|uniref:Uncharacterized protein n=1 Tax=Bemisia tabaci TaxID=7038 RepID=A0A9P0F765_BEMTA|nr:unnamed protein product [Bemisia tabaci]
MSDKQRSLLIQYMAKHTIFAKSGVLLPHIDVLFGPVEPLRVIQDNSPIHTANIVVDLNIIENVWGMMAREWDERREPTVELLGVLIFLPTHRVIPPQSNFERCQQSGNSVRPQDENLDKAIARARRCFALPNKVKPYTFPEIINADLDIWNKSPGLPWSVMRNSKNKPIFKTKVSVVQNVAQNYNRRQISKSSTVNKIPEKIPTQREEELKALAEPEEELEEEVAQPEETVEEEVAEPKFNLANGS